jgi:hypothetical protein
MSSPRLPQLALARLLAESATQTLSDAREYIMAAEDRLSSREVRALNAHIELGEILTLEASDVLADAATEIFGKSPAALS